MLPEDPYGEIQMLVAGLPDSARSIVSKSKEFRAADSVDFALMLLERAAAVDPLPVILAEHADLLAAEGQLGAALDISLQAAVSDPTNGFVREVLRTVLVEGLPQSMDYLAQIATLFAEEDEVDFAEDLLRAAIQHDPDNVRLRLMLAAFCAEHGRFTGCIVELHAVLRIEPEHAEAQLMLAEALLANRDVSGAKKWLEKSKGNGADAGKVDAIERRLRHAAASK